MINPELQAILDEPVTEESKTSVVPSQEPKDIPTETSSVTVDPEDNDSDSDSDDKPKTSTKPQAPIDPDLKWDDEQPEDSKDGGKPEDEETTPAPDQISEEELVKIEERNRWMAGRLAPVKQKLTKAEAELERLRTENEQLKAGRQAAPQEAAPQAGKDNSLDEWVNAHPKVQELSNKLAELRKQAESGEISQVDYDDQRTDLLTDVKMTKYELYASVREQQSRQEQQQRAAESAIEKSLEESILGKKEIYPDIDKAYARVCKNASSLDINIRAALIFGADGKTVNKDAADIINVVGNDRQAMSYLISQSKLAAKTGRVPVQALEYIGRLKARVEAEAEQVAPDMKDPESDRPSRAKSNLPRVIRNGAANESPSDIMEWAHNAVASGKRPW